ncbi:MAG: energy-converting hydrogenase subunit [Clostridia bacterium]|jgi:multicomponent Na+:H+ antiporter subunit B|nr:energy-converting hydrogenase subunit [Clostridia bacterium]
MLELVIETILLIFLIGTGITALKVKDLLAAIVLFGAFSFFAMLLYLIVGAPDVAFTEAVIGVVSTVFFIAALNKLKRGCKQ